MLRKMERWLMELTPWGMLLTVGTITLGMEVLAVLCRFVLGLESTRDTEFLGDWTFGIRIHHGYVGLLLLLAAWLLPHPKSWRNLAIVIGASLALSDLVHHFLVLWPLTGSPEFDLVYPERNVWQEPTNP